MIVDEQDYLEHYGVLGMKWGIRRYQPYPDGKKGVFLGDEKGSRQLKYKSPLGSKVLDATKMVAVQTASMLIPGFGLAWNAHVASDMYKYKLDSRDYNKKDGEKESIKNLKKKESPSTPEADAKAVNPGNGAGKVRNCMNCAATYEMRRRGYNVEARRASHGESTSKYSEWFDKVRYNTYSSPKGPKESRKEWVNRSYKALCDNIEKLPEGSRGFLAFNYEKQSSGHTISWEITNGEVIFYDAQAGNSKVDKVLSFSDQNYVWGRLDDLKLKDAITETCISKKSR